MKNGKLHATFYHLPEAEISMTTGRIYDRMTDISAQEMMGNLSNKRLPVSSQYVMNHASRMDIGKSNALGTVLRTNDLGIFLRVRKSLWNKIQE